MKRHSLSAVLKVSFLKESFPDSSFFGKLMEKIFHAEREV